MKRINLWMTAKFALDERNNNVEILFFRCQCQSIIYGRRSTTIVQIVSSTRAICKKPTYLLSTQA